MASTTKLVSLFNADTTVSALATTTLFVEAAYENLLGLSGAFSNKAERVGYWVAQINSGAVAKADFAAKFLEAAAVKGSLLTNAEFAANTETLKAIAAMDETTLTTLSAVKTAVTSASASAGTTSQTFTLTNSTDNIVGTTGNDTFIGDNVSSAAGDTIVGGNGIDTLKLFGAATKPNFSGIETVYLNGNTAGMDLSTNNTEVTTLQLDDVATAQVYTIASTVANMSVSNMAATEVVDIAGNTVTALNVALNGNGTAAGANDVQIDFNSTAQTEVSFTSETKKSFVELLNTGAKIATVNIAGSQDLSLESALTTVTAINAATATGAVTIAGVGASNLTFTGGSGNDKIVMGATITTADVLNGGEGTDTLSVSDADTIDTAAEVVGITGFEVFEAAGADATAYNMAIVGAKNTISGLVVSVTGGNATVSNINAATTGNITINGDAAGTVTLSAADFVSGGTSDTATINIDNSVTKAANGVDITSLVFTNVDALNIVSKGDGSSTKTVGGAEENSVILTASDAEKVVITGDEAISFATAAGTVPTEIDASGLGNGSAVSIDTDASAIASVLIKATAKNDTIDIDNAATVSSTLYLGGGTDTVTVDGGGTSAHTLIYTSTALDAGDLVKGGASVVTLTGVGAGDTVTLNFTAEIEALLKSSNSVLSATSSNINIHGTTLSSTTNVAAAQAAGNMVIQIDLNGDGAYAAADDFQITLVGTGTDDTLVYNAANDNFVFTVV